MFGTGTGGFGGLGGILGNYGNADFESLARQYWNAWGQAMRNGAASPAATGWANSDWNRAVQWWSQLVGGNSPRGPLDDVLQRFQQQASDWYGQMQQVAAQFAGTDNGAAQIGKAWREAIGANAEAANPFADIFGAMKGWGGDGLDGWAEQIKPWLETAERLYGNDQLLHLPTFGPAREHQQRWQAFAEAVQGYRQRNAEYNALLMQIGEKAFATFEVKLDEHDAPGKQIGSARALFDLWIDAAEEAYAEAALSDEFRHAIGALSNAQMRLRAAVQKEAEQFCNLFGLPTRTEVDSAHRKIAELERALRKAARAQAEPRKPVAAKTQPAPAAAEPAAAKPTVATPVVKKVAKAKPKAAAKPARKAKRKPSKKAPKPKAAASRASVASKVEATKSAATPAPKKAAAAAKAAAKKPAPAAKKRVAAPKKARPASAKKTAATKPVASKPAPATKASAKVVSMKDWVARGMASTEPPAPGKSKSGSKGGRK